MENLSNKHTGRLVEIRYFSSLYLIIQFDTFSTIDLAFKKPIEICNNYQNHY